MPTSCPNEKITIEISYVETLKYEDGAYEFVFPMVVGPRYIPGNATGKQGGGFAPDTNQSSRRFKNYADARQRPRRTRHFDCG
ncbi:MAG: hypothetical protein WKF71_01120 [Pyrinomonadaceae bacterium]